MGVEKGNEAGTSRLNKTSSVDLYRPPALRKIDTLNEQNEKIIQKRNESKQHNSESNRLMTERTGNKVQSNSDSVNINRPTRKERRPDRAVYIPRARRSLITSSQVNNTSISESTNNISYFDNNYSDNKPNIDTINNVTGTKKNSHKSVSSSSSSTQLPLTNNAVATITANDTVVKDKISKESSLNLNNDNYKMSETQSQPPSTTTISNHNDCISQEFYPSVSTKNIKELDNKIFDIDCDKAIIENNLENLDNSIDTVDSVQSNNLINNMFTTNVEPKTMIPHNSVLRIEDAINNKEEDKEIKEFQRASKEINRSNRCIIKQTFNSDILEIPESNEIEKSKLVNSQNHNENSSNSDNKTKMIDPENDDWDSMFDDNGDCIDPKILSELTASVGKVKIETPKTDYKTYHVKQAILNDEEFPHVLEVSNFPVEFKTQDLMMIFSTYKESGFDIKWVDDTHALAIFSSSRIAAEVLAMGHPFVLLKPLAQATIESRTKAKKCAASLQPYRPRPETCAALARRLVTGALGVRLKTAPEERENEKRVLREAKERKLLLAKQRDEAWEN